MNISSSFTSDTFLTALCNGVNLQVEFAIAFIGVTLARAVAAPLNSNYLEVGLL